MNALMTTEKRAAHTAKHKAATKKARKTRASLKPEGGYPLPTTPQLPLTQRETDVAHLIANDLSNIEVGKVLGISVETVKEHVQNALRKVKLRSRTGLALWYDRLNRKKS